MSIFSDFFSGVFSDPNVDLDHDGYNDAYAHEIDADGDGVSHLSLIDSNGIGYDGVAFDFDGDGNFEVSASGESGVNLDLNDNGVIGFSAIDTDGDGYTETYLADANGDGNYDIETVDYDGDNSPDRFKIDLNGDSYADIDAYDFDGDGNLDFDVDWGTVLDASLNFFSDINDDPFDGDSYTFDDGDDTDIYDDGSDTDVYDDGSDIDYYEEGGEDKTAPSDTPDEEHGYLLDTNDVPETDSFTFDVNKDGVNEGVAYDTDGDGVADTYYYDYHGNDGKIDTVGYDLNHDSYIDTIAYDTDLDGHFDMVGYDSDGDNLMDGSFAYDNDGDGVFDLTRLPADSNDNAPEYVEPTEPEPEHVEPTEPDPEYVEPTEPDPEYVEPTEPDPEYVEPTEPEPEYVEPTEPEPEYIDPIEPEPEYIDPIEPEYVEPTDTTPEEVDNYTTHDIFDENDENMSDLMDNAYQESEYGGGSTFYVDSDGDGKTDVAIHEYVHDNSITSIQYYDTDGDGQVDQIIKTQHVDTDGDTYVDTYTESIDENNDGTFDALRVYDYDAYTREKDLIHIYTEVDPTDPNFDSDVYNIDSDSWNLVEQPEQFDISESDPEKIIGDPTEEMEYWECQGQTNRCAQFAQKFIVEQYLGIEISDAEFEAYLDKAEANGWFTESGGTYAEFETKMLEEYGVPSEMSYNNEFNDIFAALDSGKHVLVNIDADEIWYGEQDGVFSPADGSNHAVDVIGIDYTDPENPMVIINDSGAPFGCGELVPLETFVDAWDDSNNFMVVAG